MPVIFKGLYMKLRSNMATALIRVGDGERYFCLLQSEERITQPNG
jgi:hypothetical protein